jgi:DNA-binding NarL/FixJ family response regulator
MWRNIAQRMAVEVIIVEGHPIVRRGLVASLGRVEGFGPTEEAGSIGEAWRHPALGEADVVVVNAALDGATDFVAELKAFTETRVLALASGHSLARLHAMLDAGAVVGLSFDDLTPQALATAIRVAAEDVSIMQRPRWEAPERQALTGHPPLSERERHVLDLVAQGLATREVGIELHYSERTVKKVLGDVVLKLGARSRSQAIAHAVREGII